MTPDPPRPAQPGPAGRPEPAAAPGRPARGTATADADLVRERWPEILEAVKHRSRVAWTQLSNATVDTLQEGILTLRFAQVGMATGFSARGSDEDLSQVLQKMLGIRPKIRAIAEGAAGAAHEGRAVRGGGGPAAGSREPGPSGGPGEPAPAPAGEGAAGRRSVRAEDSVLNATARPTAAGNAAVASEPNTRTAHPNAGQAGPPVAQADPEVPDHDPDASALTGMDLIQRTLGGQVIEEIGDA